MKITIGSLFSQSSHSFTRVILLCLSISLVASACGGPPATQPAVPTDTAAPPPTATSTPVPEPIIETGGPCQLDVGKTLPLAVKGVAGANVVYRWTATAGNVNPPDGPAVIYTAPTSPQDVIIRVEAEQNGVTSVATITCQVSGPTPTPETPTPVPTQWACTSARAQKLANTDIPGQVTIDTPAQGTSDIQSGQSVQVRGSYSGLPAGNYIWVFIYSPDAGLHGRYYPQTRDALQSWQPEPTTEQGGPWSLNVGFGAPNLCYEVIVMVADAAASQSIADQLKSWADLDNYAGYELNGPLTALPPDGPGLPAGLVEKASIEVRTR